MEEEELVTRGDKYFLRLVGASTLLVFVFVLLFCDVRFTSSVASSKRGDSIYARTGDVMRQRYHASTGLRKHRGKQYVDEPTDDDSSDDGIADKAAARSPLVSGIGSEQDGVALKRMREQRKHGVNINGWNTRSDKKSDGRAPPKATPPTSSRDVTEPNGRRR
eukprot:GFYU01018787.1.p1 GENE.GFYU01018787.1~~GFYU01018787.1.p1  ORF type:complete len:163 (-),score=14.33 GFYU01018787.1:232-720(-)